jgi:hypothetical protein
MQFFRLPGDAGKRNPSVPLATGTKTNAFPLRGRLFLPIVPLLAGWEKRKPSVPSVVNKYYQKHITVILN